MSRGPLPNANRRRTNPPVIPTTTLPAGGRTKRAPAVPKGYTLRTAGRAWWNWAWKQPQAVMWDAGALYVVARRGQLEDDLTALKPGETGRPSVMREMRELDNRLGLNPKAMAELRWTIGDEAPSRGSRNGSSDGESNVAQMDDYRDRLG